MAWIKMLFSLSILPWRDENSLSETIIGIASSSYLSGVYQGSALRHMLFDKPDLFVHQTRYVANYVNDNTRS